MGKNRCTLPAWPEIITEWPGPDGAIGLVFSVYYDCGNFLGKIYLPEPLECGEFPPRTVYMVYPGDIQHQKLNKLSHSLIPATPRRQYPMAYAVFKTGGKQYRVQKGDSIDVEKIDAEVGSEAKFDEVLLVNDGKATKVGTPTVEGAAVTAKVVDQFRGKKGIAFKFKRRQGYHKTKGYRRHLTKLEITSIS
jgi:large subunit ribosomal protein L21